MGACWNAQSSAFPTSTPAKSASFSRSRKSPTSRRPTCAHSWPHGSPATRCPSRSNSGTNCRRRTSARSCGGHCVTNPNLGLTIDAVPMIAGADDVVSFWQEAGPDRWFDKDPAFDAEIRARFLATHEAAAAGQLSEWEQTAHGALALLILLDQFPRNMFRGEARA